MIFMIYLQSQTEPLGQGGGRALLRGALSRPNTWGQILLPPLHLCCSIGCSVTQSNAETKVFSPKCVLPHRWVILAEGLRELELAGGVGRAGSHHVRCLGSASQPRVPPSKSFTSSPRRWWWWWWFHGAGKMSVFPLPVVIRGSWWTGGLYRAHKQLGKGENQPFLPLLYPHALQRERRDARVQSSLSVGVWLVSLQTTHFTSSTA